MKQNQTQDEMDEIRVDIGLKDLYQYFKYLKGMFTVMYIKRKEIYQNKVDEMGQLRWDGQNK